MNIFYKKKIFLELKNFYTWPGVCKEKNYFIYFTRTEKLYYDFTKSHMFVI